MYSKHGAVLHHMVKEKNTQWVVYLIKLAPIQNNTCSHVVQTKKQNYLFMCDMALPPSLQKTP